MVLAHLAGIKIFATGGLGGVHRGSEVTMDISADLTELGRTPVTVVSSGCKSFLDIPRTLEYLETQGVGVGTFADGRDGTVEFPAFWTRDSGIKSPAIIKDEQEAAVITCKCGPSCVPGMTVLDCVRRRPICPRPLLWSTLCESRPKSIFHSQISDGCDHGSSYSRCKGFRLDWE